MMLEIFEQRDRLLDEYLRLQEARMRQWGVLIPAAAALTFGSMSPVTAMGGGAVHREESIPADFKEASKYIWTEVKGQPEDTMKSMMEICANILKAYGKPLEVAKKKFVAPSRAPDWFVKKLWEIYKKVPGIKYVYHSFVSDKVDMSEYVPASWVSKYWAGDAKPVELDVYWGYGKEKRGKVKFYKLSDLKKAPYKFYRKFGNDKTGWYFVYLNSSE